MIKTTHPTLLLDEGRCRNNIKRMAEKAKNKSLAFKPHFKTHQSRKVGAWFKELGVGGITVSSIAMAEYFADAGWEDITIAFPANILAIDQINALASKITLTILADNDRAIEVLGHNMLAGIRVLIELNAGSNRTGIEVDDHQGISRLAEQIERADKLHFDGFYSHFGHTYSARGEEEVLTIFNKSMQKINKMISVNHFEHKALHIGDTPGCSLLDDFTGVTAITPGNFVFYDVMQSNIGSCKLEDISIAMACPVVSKSRSRKEICIHGGAVHFSKDSILVGAKPSYGLPVLLKEKGIGEAIEGSLSALSQEHGVVKFENDALFNQVKIGDVIGILPIHSCLSAQCMNGYFDFKNNAVDHM